jgi:hypothetical protein
VQYIGDRAFVGEAQHVVEVVGCVLRVAAGVRPAQHGDGTAPPRQIADGVGGLRRTGEGPDDQYVRIVCQFAYEILGTGVADIADVMAQLLAPHRYDLRHDAREVGIHDAAEEIAPAALADEIENGDLQAMHDGPFQGDCERRIKRGGGVSRSGDLHANLIRRPILRRTVKLRGTLEEYDAIGELARPCSYAV